MDASKVLSFRLKPRGQSRHGRTCAESHRVFTTIDCDPYDCEPYARGGSSRIVHAVRQIESNGVSYSTTYMDRIRQQSKKSLFEDLSPCIIVCILQRTEGITRTLEEKLTATYAVIFTLIAGSESRPALPGDVGAHVSITDRPGNDHRGGA